MFHAPGYSHIISTRLSGILSDCGVNENIVQKRRRANLLQETLATITSRLNGNNWSDYRFGSQTEGATTIGLQSDIDDLGCLYDFAVIQDWSEWQPGVRNLLMVQSDGTYPGYCFLQELRKDMPLPFDADESNNYFVKDTQGRTLLKNTIIDTALRNDQKRQGPSLASCKQPGICDQDMVPAFHCKSWPHSARCWLDQHSSRKLTQNVKKTAADTGCFVVAIGSKVSECSDAEWRISTSLVERNLMFSLNSTQIRCYVLMKMIVKTYINNSEESYISSFMCKTVLLHLIEKLPPSMWKECNLLKCLTGCLVELYQRVSCGNCPHVTIPENNLMVGKYSSNVKHQLKEKLKNLMKTMGKTFLGIHIDYLGHRLQNKSTAIQHLGVTHQVQEEYPVRKGCLIISGSLLRHTAQVLRRCHDQVVCGTTYDTLERKLKHLFRYTEGSLFEQASYNLLSPLLCSTLGSRHASTDIHHSSRVSHPAWVHLTKGINSDATSGRLKLASVFYSTGDMESAIFVLNATEGQYDESLTEPVCVCSTFNIQIRQKNFGKYSLNKNEEGIQHIVAFCVRFFPFEMENVPHELRYEMFRFFLEDQGRREDMCTGSAVVDSLSYLYFLQYKACAHLNRHVDKQKAFKNLVKSVDKVENVEHKETALNLLGQCMEYENRPKDAFQCYVKSLDFCAKNNAAKFHICKLLAKYVCSEC